MRVAIIDGTCKKASHRIGNLTTEYIKGLGHRVDYLKISEMKIAYCIGCWSCWVKTPGRCIHEDGTQLLLRSIINSNLVIHLTERSLGTITSLSKKTLDKSIPLVHPYIKVFQGECHHLHRYDHYPQHALIFIDREKSKKHLSLAVRYLDRATTNLKGGIGFSDVFTGEEVSIDESNLAKWFSQR